jgi:nitrogen regulatory protein PII
MSDDIKELIVTIVNKGWGDTVMEASMKAGAGGGTIIFGRGVGIHEKKKILGIPIEPEKEIVLTVISQKNTDVVIEAIIKAARLGEPGRGIAFTLPVDRFVGVVHALAESHIDLPVEIRDQPELNNPEIME